MVNHSNQATNGYLIIRTYLDFIRELKLFKTWTSGIKLHPWDFAKSGFYYTGGGDAVTCFFCVTTVTNWQMAEDVNTEHKKTFSIMSLLEDDL